MLRGGFTKKYQSIEYPFDCIGIAINNKVPEGVKEEFAGKADIILDVPKIQDEVLEYFNLKEKDFKGGLVYSIAELAAIRACDTDYLCYVQGDCLCTTGDWVTEGVKVLEREPQTSVVSPLSDVNTWHDNLGHDQYFSDQAWLVRVKEFQKPIYTGGEDIPDYPLHGGDSFEKKVAQYLRKEGKARKVLMGHWYDHPVY